MRTLFGQGLGIVHKYFQREIRLTSMNVTLARRAVSPSSLPSQAPAQHMLKEFVTST